MGEIWTPSREVLVATPGLEVLGKGVAVFRFRGYKKYDPLRALRGEVPGELAFDTGPIHNLSMNAGKSVTLQRLFGIGVAGAMSSIGVGTDTTAAAATQTQLNPSVSGSVYIQAFDSTPLAPLGTPPVLNCQMTIGTGNGNFLIAEAAIFNGTTNGTSTMLNRLVVPSPPTKTSGISLVIQFAYTQN